VRPFWIVEEQKFNTLTSAIKTKQTKNEPNVMLMFPMLDQFWTYSTLAKVITMPQAPQTFANRHTRLKKWWIIMKWALKRTLPSCKRFARISFPWEHALLRS